MPRQLQDHGEHRTTLVMVVEAGDPFGLLPESSPENARSS